MRYSGSFAMLRVEIGYVSDLITSRWTLTFVYSWRGKRQWREQCLMPLKKPCVASDGNSGTPIAALTGSWGKSFPTICEFLSSVQWEDGSSRECGKLTLFWDRSDGSWKVCLNCHHTSRSAFVSAGDPVGALQAAEKGLEGDRLDWRPWRGPQKGKRG